MKQLRVVFIIALFGMVSLSQAATYILVHGAFQTASAWDRVVPFLEDAGNTVVAVNLPGRADDTTPVAEITLQDYVDTVVSIIEQQSESVILVGHSFGGIVISQVAETIPDKIKTLVYVAAYLPLSGESLVTLSRMDHWNGFAQDQEAFVVAPDYSYAEVLERARVNIFCADCTEADAELVKSSMVKEPLAPLGTPVTLSAEKFGKVPKVYIETTDDNAVSYLLQIIMQRNVSVDQHIWLHTSHVPFITMPNELAAILAKL
jgi:pimeloyl-ACP methyl ester carboxylesterase